MAVYLWLLLCMVVFSLITGAPMKATQRERTEPTSFFSWTNLFGTLRPPEPQVNARQSNRTFEWGSTFGGLSPRSLNVEYKCSYNGEPICCDLATTAPHGDVGAMVDTHGSPACEITKQYISSAYEIRQFEMASSLENITDPFLRRALLVDFVRKDVNASNLWLERIRVHMQTARVEEITDGDLYYLSRFKVTKKCGIAAPVSWLEWIEPLTVHARHPFAFKECKDVYTAEDIGMQKFPSTIQNMDYVLIHSGADMKQATAVPKRGRSSNNATSLLRGAVNTPTRPHHAHGREAHVKTHSYFFDAGTSTFQSSLRWFLCAYQQVRGLFSTTDTQSQH
jgi:hypothetical protein